MKKFFNWVLVLAACVGAFYGIGLIVPRSLTSTSRVDLGSRPDDVVGKFADVKAWPDWFPDVMTVREQPEHNGNATWRVTKKDGKTYDLEVIEQDERLWQATYTFDQSLETLRVMVSGLGDGSRAQVTRTTLTHDTWLRARHFLFMQSEPSPLEMLNAVASALGEHASAKDV